MYQNELNILRFSFSSQLSEEFIIYFSMTCMICASNSSQSSGKRVPGFRQPDLRLLVQ